MEETCTCIIVIGSGIAGLNAAKMLTQCLPDCKITVLEALSRPGGRVNSLKITHENEYLEEGAAYLHSIENNPIKEHLTQHPALMINNIQPKYCKINGDDVSAEHAGIFCRLFDKLICEAKGIHRTKRTSLKNGIKSVGEFIQKQFLQELENLKLTTEGEKIASSVFQVLSLSESCDRGSLYDLLLEDFGEYEEIKGEEMIVKGGYSQVIEELLKNLPENCVVYNSSVTEIHWKNDHIPKEPFKPVRVICENGEQYFADHVITTPSLGHLKAYARALFKPSLPQVKLDIIDRMGFNYITKIHLRYKTPFWKDTITIMYLLWDKLPENAVNKITDFTEETWFRQISEFAVHPLLSNTLEVWLCGESALHAESLEIENISETCTGLLRRFLNDPSIPEPDEISKTSWNNNPYFLGGYSYVAVGSSGGQDFDGLAEPVCVENSEGVDTPRVLFAGEATHRTYYSTTHGALLSGEREAERLISFYQARL